MNDTTLLINDNDDVYNDGNTYNKLARPINTYIYINQDIVNVYWSEWQRLRIQFKSAKGKTFVGLRKWKLVKDKVTKTKEFFPSHQGLDIPIEMFCKVLLPIFEKIRDDYNNTSNQKDIKSKD